MTGDRANEILRTVITEGNMKVFVPADTINYFMRELCALVNEDLKAIPCPEDGVDVWQLSIDDSPLFDPNFEE